MSELGSIVTESLPDSLNSNQLELVHLRYSFIVGLGLFVVGFPFYRSKKSFFDPVAARRVVRIARFFILLELLLAIILLIFYFEYGSPVEINQQLTYADAEGTSNYGRGESWLYGYARPAAALVFIGIGLMAEVHPAIRFVCLFACCGEVMSAAFSAVQVRDYYRQVRFNDAPDHGYSLNSLLAYYWREIISVAVCTLIALLMGHLLCVVGCCDPQILPAALISGKDLDRFTMMQQQRERRRIMEVRGVLGPVKDGTGKATLGASSIGEKKARRVHAPAAKNAVGETTVVAAEEDGLPVESAVDTSGDTPGAADRIMENTNQSDERKMPGAAPANGHITEHSADDIWDL